MLQTADMPDDVLDALGNPERRRLVRRLAEGPLSVSELAAGFDISRPAISRHLATLERAGLVTHRGVGTRNLYSLDPRGFAATRRWLEGFWDEAEARLRLLAENLGDGR